MLYASSPRTDLSYNKQLLGTGLRVEKRTENWLMPSRWLSLGPPRGRPVLVQTLFFFFFKGTTEMLSG